MKIHKDIEQRSEEWFKLRIGKATGSVADKLVSDSSPFKTLTLQKACEIINQKPIESDYVSEDMQRGTDLEGIVNMQYQIKTGNTVEQCAFIEYNDYAGYSPDGLIANNGLLEIKCPRANNHLSYIIGAIPSKYKWQMQFGMFCSGRAWCDFVSYCEDFDEEHQLYIKRIEIDPNAQDKIREKLTKFETEINSTIKKYKESK